MTILFFGDISGKSGREAVRVILPRLQKELRPDFVMANVENAAHGKGITPKTITQLEEAGIEFFTSGNHVFDKPPGREVFESMPEKIIRPANFPDELPGRGFQEARIKDVPVLFINLNGLVFMEEQFDFGEIGNPFQKLEEILRISSPESKVKILDFHAEATSEKRAMGFFADGRLSAVIGTHTHVQSADAQVLPGGTGYITDLGMTGPARSVIGAEADGIVQRFYIGEDREDTPPIRPDESDRFEIGYCLLEIDETSGKCQNIVSKLEYIE